MKKYGKKYFKRRQFRKRKRYNRKMRILKNMPKIDGTVYRTCDVVDYLSWRTCDRLGVA